ncbi:MAG: hypothetical protein J6X62_02975 [Bacteroidales bacterium]|nr:hypothetical protein [Bacteroidales bacterium]
MKRGLKIALISLVSILGLLIIVVAVACWLVFTPARLTKIVNGLSDKYIECEAHFDKVDLTLFKTFPCAGLDIHNVVLVNPVGGGCSDTLASIPNLTVGVDLMAFVKQGSVIVHKLRIDDAVANVYFDSLGVSNLDIFKTDDTDTTASEPFELPEIIDIDHIAINDLKACYIDEHNKIEANADGFSVKLKLKGDAEALKADLGLCLKEAALKIDTTVLLTPATVPQGRQLLDIELVLNTNADLNSGNIEKCSIKVGGRMVQLDLSGDIKLPTDDSDMQMALAFATNNLVASEVIALAQPVVDILPEGINADAKLKIEGRVDGVLNDSVMPLIDALVVLEDGQFHAPDLLPYKFNNINAKANAVIDLSSSNPKPSTVKLTDIHAQTGHNKLSLSGKVDDLLGAMLTDLTLKADLQLQELKPLLPSEIAINSKNLAHLDLHAKTNLRQIENVDIANMLIDGALRLKNVSVQLDSIEAETPELNVTFNTTPNQKGRVEEELLTAKVSSTGIHANIANANMLADLSKLKLDVSISNILDTTVPFAMDCIFDIGGAKVDMDTVKASLASPSGNFKMQPYRSNPARIKYDIDYNCGRLEVEYGDSLSASLAGLSLKGTADYDSTRQNILKQWNPNLDINIKNGYLAASALPYTLQVPDIRFNYKPEKCQLAHAALVFGNSDIFLDGVVFGLEEWISHEGMLRGDLNLTSNYTNVDDLLDAISGLGTDADTLEAQRAEDNVPAEANPFIVPKDVDVTLHTRFRQASAFGNDVSDLGGDITVRDGVAVLNEIGFMCKAARMQLTALYRTPRVNHIFLGLDFHLLDIYVDELVDMIPCVDTLLPMLSAFDGKADFHLCAETYLNAFYQPKMSTLRGAAAITGDSLVVMDNASIDNIVKLIGAKDWRVKDDKLMIDSLDVAMTVFRKEVEVYPFQLNMNKYNLVVSGRHNLDMNYDYHLEIIKSPLPARLAVDVMGVMPNLKFSLSKLRYAELYKPEKRNEVQQQTIALKNLIKQSLEANVKQETRTKQRAN